MSIYKVVWVSSADEIDITIWNDCFPKNVEGYWWYKALEQSNLEDQFQFFYGVLYDSERPIGIIPCFIMNLPLDVAMPDILIKLLKHARKLRASLGYIRTMFIGSPCADEGTIGIKSGQKFNELISTIQEACDEHSKALDISLTIYKDFSDYYSQDMAQLTDQNGFIKMVSFPGATLNLAGCNSFETYLMQLSGKHRYSVRKNLSKSKKSIELLTKIVQMPDPTLIDELFNLFWGTYSKGKTKFEQLNKQFFINIAKNPDATFICLYAKDSNKLVAFMLCFTVGNKIINKYIGMDYSLPKETSLCFRLWEEAVIWAIQSKAVEFQAGQTGYPFKLQAGCTLVPLWNYVKHRNRLVHGIFKLIAKHISWASLDEDLKGHIQ